MKDVIGVYRKLLTVFGVFRRLARRLLAYIVNFGQFLAYFTLKKLEVVVTRRQRAIVDVKM